MINYLIVQGRLLSEGFLQQSQTEACFKKKLLMLHIPLKGKLPTDLSWAGLVMTLGIVYGDLGTSPLYTMQAILRAAPVINKDFILGALSCVFWTLTLQTSFKYVLITLRASNQGEGGIFSLFTLIKQKKRWTFIAALIGACALLGDGVITPSITVTSAVEGLQMLVPSIPVVFGVLVILSGLFFSQQFGTSALGKYFGPAMVVWFSMLSFFGLIELIHMPEIFKAINPYYAIRLIMDHPHALILLGAVFLCTTGAEALYSDLGHCGLKNIRISWIFVKISLLLSYFGQGAWVLNNLHHYATAQNPFFGIMPHWFLPIGVVISTLAAIIASQALISGAFSVVSEAISLNYFPKLRINYPTSSKGQMYIPFINKILFVCCVFVVLYFKSSDAMEAAYGLSITVAMLMTSLLLMFYLQDRIAVYWICLIGLVFFTIETTFLVANLTKFFEGGWMSVALSVLFFSVMFVWFRGSGILNGFIKQVKINAYTPILESLSKDETVPKYATHLVYTSRLQQEDEVERQIIYSILRNQPKRADVYWFLHLYFSDKPYEMTYQVKELSPGKVIRVNLHLGYKTEPRVNLYFTEVVADLVRQGRLTPLSSYPSLRAANVLADFRFVIINTIQNNDFDFTFYKQLLMNYFFLVKRAIVNEVKFWGFDPSLIVQEDVSILSSSEIMLADKEKREE